MQDTGLGDVAFKMDLHPFPRQPVTLTAPPQRAHPGNDDVVAERADRRHVVWHRMIREEPAHHRSEPCPLLGERGMHPPPKLVVAPRALRHDDRPDLGLHPFACRLAPELEATLPRLPADVREAEEVERVGLAVAALRPVSLRMADELDQARLLWMQLQRKRRQSLLQIGEETIGITAVLKAVAAKRASGTTTVSSAYRTNTTSPVAFRCRH